MGKTLARRLVERSVANGHRPEQVAITPLHVAGVGDGSQTCKFKMQCPVAIPTGDTALLHNLNATIVEGTGEDLPGLLGLETLENRRAILDMGKRQLIFPGAGEITYQLPPGSTVIPLEKAPSGHLCMVVDTYNKLSPPSSGGVKRPVPTLLSVPGSAQHLPVVQEGARSSGEQTTGEVQAE